MQYTHKLTCQWGAGLATRYCTRPYLGLLGGWMWLRPYITLVPLASYIKPLGQLGGKGADQI